MRFIESLLKDINPESILETGTESALFCYFVKCVLPKVKVVTFGMNDGCNETGDNRSEKCTNFLNEKFDNYIEFIEGDSRFTLTNYNTTKQIDFAWIDGGHIHDILFSDLENCNRLGIKHICIDDCIMIPEVKNTVLDFLTKYNNYKLVSKTNENRGIYYIAIL
jgi:hypothetical protein